METSAHGDFTLPSHEFKSQGHDHPRVEHHEAKFLPNLSQHPTAFHTTRKPHLLRSLFAPTPREVTKWFAYALILVAPGSFVVLPVLWLARLLECIAARKYDGRSKS